MNIKTMPKVYFLICNSLLLLVLGLTSGCVTTVTGGFSDKASPQKAAENYTKLGVAYFKQGNTERAREKLRKALEIRPQYAPAHDAMGLLWQRTGEFEYAQESFLNAIKYDATLNLARHHYALLLMQKKQYQLADAQFLIISKDRFYKNRPQVFKDLAISAYQQKNVTQAVNYYRRALRLTPYDPTALVNITTLLFERQQYTQANKYFTRLEEMVAAKATEHTAHSLWLGIRLGEELEQVERVYACGAELEKRFASSKEYAQYQSSRETKAPLQDTQANSTTNKTEEPHAQSIITKQIEAEKAKAEKAKAEKAKAEKAKTEKAKAEKAKAEKAKAEKAKAEKAKAEKAKADKAKADKAKAEKAKAEKAKADKAKADKAKADKAKAEKAKAEKAKAEKAKAEKAKAEKAKAEKAKAEKAKAEKAKAEKAKAETPAVPASDNQPQGAGL